jgi:hypothetical protein
VVYHGLAGHFFVKGISHVLKIRIIAEMEDRVKLEMERENISRSKALQILKSDDEERRKWSRHLFGIDTWDTSLYDLVIHIKKLSSDDAADFVCHTARLEQFRTTPESQQAMDDLTMSAKVKATLIDLKPDVEVSAENGVVRVKLKSVGPQEEGQIRSLAKETPSVKDVKIDVQGS